MWLKAMIKLIVVVADHRSMIEETGGDHMIKEWSIGEEIRIIEEIVDQKVEEIGIRNSEVI